MTTYFKCLISLFALTSCSGFVLTSVSGSDAVFLIDMLHTKDVKAVKVTKTSTQELWRISYKDQISNPCTFSSKPSRFSNPWPNLPNYPKSLENSESSQPYQQFVQLNHKQKNAFYYIEGQDLKMRHIASAKSISSFNLDFGSEDTYDDIKAGETEIDTLEANHRPKLECVTLFDYPRWKHLIFGVTTHNVLFGFDPSHTQIVTWTKKYHKDAIVTKPQMIRASNGKWLLVIAVICPKQWPGIKVVFIDPISSIEYKHFRMPSKSNQALNFTFVDSLGGGFVDYIYITQGARVFKLNIQSPQSYDWSVSGSGPIFYIGNNYWLGKPLITRHHNGLGLVVTQTYDSTHSESGIIQWLDLNDFTIGMSKSKILWRYQSSYLLGPPVWRQDKLVTYQMKGRGSVLVVDGKTGVRTSEHPMGSRNGNTINNGTYRRAHSNPTPELKVLTFEGNQKESDIFVLNSDYDLARAKVVIDYGKLGRRSFSQKD